jgi:NitT/TauT family transport system permease protein
VKTIRTILPPALTFIVVILFWAAAKKIFGISDFTLPSPWQVAKAFDRYANPLLRATLTTAESSLAGFASSIAIGILAGIILSSGRWIERAVYPFTIFLQTVPLVAVAPILVLWFDTGFTSVTICAFIVSVFPVIANTLLGMRSVDPALHDLFTIYRASWAARLFKLKLPWALPSIFTGLRISAGLAVIGAIVGEFSAGTFTNQGLGILILSAKRTFNMDEVFAAVFLASVLGLVAFALVNIAAYWFLGSWHVSEQRGAANRR